MMIAVPGNGPTRPMHTSSSPNSNIRPVRGPETAISFGSVDIRSCLHSDPSVSVEIYRPCLYRHHAGRILTLQPLQNTANSRPNRAGLHFASWLPACWQSGGSFKHREERCSKRGAHAFNHSCGFSTLCLSSRTARWSNDHEEGR